jgi:hypothetical protein
LSRDHRIEAFDICVSENLFISGHQLAGFDDRAM